MSEQRFIATRDKGNVFDNLRGINVGAVEIASVLNEYVLQAATIAALTAKLADAVAALQQIQQGAGGNSGNCLDCDTINAIASDARAAAQEGG